MKRDGVGKMLLQVTPKDERKRGAKEEGEKFQETIKKLIISGELYIYC